MNLEGRGTALAIRLIFNSSCEDVLCKKCLGLPDQNVELQVRNNSASDIFLVSALDLVGDEGTHHIPNLFPYGEHRLGPGDSMSLYTYLDEGQIGRYHTAVLHDTEGRQYSAPLEPARKPCGSPHTLSKDERI